MTPKQQKERLRRLRLAEDARDFMTRVLDSPQPIQVLLKYVENTKLRQFLKADLFDSDAIAKFHTLFRAFPESDLERLSSKEDICALVFPRTNYCFRSFFLSSGSLLSLLKPAQRSDFYTYKDCGWWFSSFQKLQLERADLQRIPIQFWAFVQGRPDLMRAFMSEAADYLPAMERALLQEKHSPQLSMACDAL